MCHTLVSMFECNQCRFKPSMNIRRLGCNTGSQEISRNPCWIWNPGQTSPYIQNRSTSNPTKGIICAQKYYKLLLIKTYWFISSNKVSSVLPHIHSTLSVNPKIEYITWSFICYDHINFVISMSSEFKMLVTTSIT